MINMISARKLLALDKLLLYLEKCLLYMKNMSVRESGGYISGIIGKFYVILMFMFSYYLKILEVTA